jgi:DNA polymerase-3 subunit beta
MLIQAIDIGVPVPVHLTCTDGETTFTASLDAHLEEEGGCVLPGKLLTEVIRYLPDGDVHLETRENKVEVTCGRAKYAFPGQPGESFPEWPSLAGSQCVVDGPELAAGLRKVLPAASDQEAVLATVLLHLEDRLLTLVACDRYRMGVVQLDTAGASLASAKLPSRVAERFAASRPEGNVSIGFGENLVSLTSELLTVTARQPAGKYLPWQKVMASPEIMWACETRALEQAARLAALSGERIELDFGDGITVRGVEGFSVVESGYDGEPLTVAVGSRNLLAGLAGCGKTVRYSVTGKLRPVILDSEGLRWLVQARREVLETCQGQAHGIPEDHGYGGSRRAAHGCKPGGEREPHGNPVRLPEPGEERRIEDRPEYESPEQPFHRNPLPVVRAYKPASRPSRRPRDACRGLASQAM